MAFPTSGYSPLTVNYLISSNAGAKLSIEGAIINGENEAEMEELLTYLDSALVSFKSSYSSGTSYTVGVNKSFNGETTPSAL
jgi:hypothetical protein